MKFLKNAKLDQLLNGEPNSIGFIRLLMASLVLVGHSLSFFDGVAGPFSLIPLTNNQVALGRFPVDVFFALSGFLIAASFERARTLRAFLGHRFLRIYPAYWVCIFITGLLVPLLFQLRPDFTYVLKNLLLIVDGRSRVAGLFVNNPGSQSTNSSLWTLPWELKAYLFLFVFGYFGWLKNQRIVLCAFLVCWILFVSKILNQTDINSIDAVTSGVRLFTFFLAGMTAYVFRNQIRLTSLGAILSLLALVAATWFGNQFVPKGAGLFYIVAPIPLTYLSFWMCACLPPIRINSEYDFSYGVYIYGTLMLQILAGFGMRSNYFLYLATAIFVTYILSAISWYVVEKPALSLKSKEDFIRRRPASANAH